jgi:glycogen operon protein
VTSPDGFTLADWAAYDQRHNEANGEDNRDGPPESFSHNWGAEGPTDDAAINDLRARVTRALLATLFGAHGTPMLLGGDEFGRTQQGNNNAYCQDAPLSWHDWPAADAAAGRAGRAWAARLAQLRRELVTLRSSRFLHAREEPAPGLRDSDWFDEQGRPMSVEAWHEAGRAHVALRRAARREDGRVEITLLLINGGAQARRFELPPPRLLWHLRLDSARPQVPEQPLADAAVDVPAHAAVLLSALATPPDDSTRGQA